MAIQSTQPRGVYRISAAARKRGIVSAFIFKNGYALDVVTGLLFPISAQQRAIPKSSGVRFSSTLTIPGYFQRSVFTRIFITNPSSVGNETISGSAGGALGEAQIQINSNGTFEFNRRGLVNYLTVNASGLSSFCAGFSCDVNSQKAYLDGKQVASRSGTVSFILNSGLGGTLSTASDQTLSLHLEYDGALSDQDMATVTANPWQEFELFEEDDYVVSMEGNTFSYSGVGGIVFSGSPQKARGNAYNTTGGLVLAGATSIAKGRSWLATGGLKLAGNATAITSTLKSFVIQGVGGLLLSGTSTLRRQVTAIASGGGVIFSGTGGARGYIAGDLAVLLGAINDVIYQSLRRMGQVGSRNDMLNENIYWRALANNNQILSLNDVKKLVLRNLGYTGALNNMEKAYWSER